MRKNFTPLFNIPFYLTSQQLFWLALLATLIIKLYIAHIVPITGDEAEYVYWSQHLSWGYYDHPPMIGWLLSPFSSISLENIWLRLPQILTSTIIGYAIYLILKKLDEQKAAFIAVLYLLSPVSLFNQGILTDTPLTLFSFLAIINLFFAANNDKYRYYLLAGFFIGAAYFSKYLMFPIALSILFFFLFTKHIKHKWRKFILLGIAASPFLIQNLIWNYHHDWVNLLFNLNLRNVHDHFELYKPLSYIISIIYLYNPLVIYYAGKKIKDIYKLKTNTPFSIFILTTFTTLVFYGILSITKRIGLHWIFSAYPFLFISLFPVLKTTIVKKCVAFMYYYSLIQLIIVIALFNLPISVWKQTPYFPKINWFLDYQKVATKIQPYLEKGFFLATPSYAQSYLLAYKHKNNAAVWGSGSVHGRQDDLFTDFKKIANKNMLIIDINNKLSPSEITPYFKKVTTTYGYLNRMPYKIILGYQFDYPAYHHDVLQKIYSKYYRVPSFLPRSKALFKDKYNF